MASHINKLDVPVLVGVGAAFDFLAGTKSQAPAWMQCAGLEWVYRFGCEPRRLWRRYARVVPLFICLAALQLIGEHVSKLYRSAIAIRVRSATPKG
jgi:N-acetylglucosaminyldiphosphoundecaprenol N-acetyl-beta-D-mannosaminyltransferase